jgi:hypothetical protein
MGLVKVNCVDGVLATLPFTASLLLGAPVLEDEAGSRLNGANEEMGRTKPPSNGNSLSFTHPSHTQSTNTRSIQVHQINSGKYKSMFD